MSVMASQGQYAFYSSKRFILTEKMDLHGEAPSNE